VNRRSDTALAKQQKLVGLLAGCSSWLNSTASLKHLST